VFRIGTLFVALMMSADAFAQAPRTPAGDAGRAGWNAIRDGRNDEAAAAFAAAIETEPRDPSLYLGAGLAAQLVGDTNKARKSLEQALALAPNFTAASLMLGDLLYHQSDLQGAIAIFEAAMKHAPSDKTLAGRLASLRQEPSPERGFFQSQSAHFVVLFEGPADDELARRAVDPLESAPGASARRSIRSRPRHYRRPHTEQQFRDTTRSPSWAAAAHDGWIRIPMRARSTRPWRARARSHPRADPRNTRAIAPRAVPTWLNEGWR
jgi:tetratricopeptide (TPR) repeat protein